MSDFLAEMARASSVRAQRLRAQVDPDALIAKAGAMPPPEPLRLRGFDLIAEVKWASPSAGALADAGADAETAVAARARRYATAGAAAISVLTEPSRFGGALEHMSAAAAVVDVPVMRKDFLVDPLQVAEARAAGAGGVLLITRMLDDSTLAAMLGAARRFGLFTLLEAFDADDLARSGRAIAGFEGGPPVLLGLNARDLVTLTVDPTRLMALGDAFPPGWPAVAESGLETPGDAARLAHCGYALALVGSALMRADDPEGLAARMIAAGRESVCASE